MLTYMSSGILSSEVALVMMALKSKHGIYFAEMRDYLEGYRYPHYRKRNAPTDAFSTTREKKSAETFKVDLCRPAWKVVGMHVEPRC